MPKRKRRCETCAWWEEYGLEHKKGRGSCSITSSDFGEPIHPESLAVAQDYESYAATLETHKNFGCVQWEKQT